MTQEALAKAMSLTQPRVARIEAGSRGVSLDMMVRAYLVAGGKLERVFAKSANPAKKDPHAKKKAPASKKTTVKV